MRGIIRLLTCCFILIFGYFANAWSAPMCTRTYQSCTSDYWMSNGVCTACTPGCTCDGTTMVCTISCSAGQYLNNQTCTDCPAGSYCPGGEWTPNGGVQGLNSCSSLSGVSVSGGTYSSAVGSSASTACQYTAPNKTITGCESVTTNTVTYSGTAWPATTYSVSASGGYIIADDGTANATCSICGAGTYSAGGAATSCNSCDDGQYQNESGKTSCKACSALGGGLYTKSDGSRNADTTCYITTTAGKYLAAKTDTTQTTCPATNYCPSAKLYYPNVNTPTACPATDSTTARTTFPDSYLASENLQRTWFSQQSWTTGITSEDGCMAVYSFSNNRGNFSVESVKYNSATGKYDTGGDPQYYTKVNPGYYLSVPYSSTYCNASTNRMLYQSALPCPTGSYCPGYTSVPLCNSGLTYGDDIGITGCPSNYSNSAEKSDDINDCYLTTSSGKYVATAGAGQTTCACGGYCSGGTTVYYDGTGGWTGCGVGKYNSSTGSSASSACSTAAAGYVANSSCSATACTGATYQDETGKASCKSCPTATSIASRVTGYWYWSDDGVHDHLGGCRADITENDSNGNYSLSCAICNGDYGVNGSCDSSTCMANSPSSCVGGYYWSAASSGDVWNSTAETIKTNACIPVGDGYYSEAGALTRTECPYGLTTIGYGAGADEAGDCGRKLHLGDNVLYLRSAQRTTPSLRFDTDNDGVANLFGNMSTTSHKMSDGATKSYKTTYNGSTYYIYDDSAQ
ncbi:MAG: hypothetical protein ACLRFJ_01760 [Alphaproteobacteria bacterium]